MPTKWRGYLDEARKAGNTTAYRHYWELCVLLGLRDSLQGTHSVLRNYPVIGHMRYLFEFIRPEIRQYFIEGDNESAPFSRQQRSLVYQRAKGDPDKRPFGTQLDVTRQGYEWINHSLAPTRLPTHDFRVTIGASRPKPYSASVFNISAMSFGSLSANAIKAEDDLKEHELHFKPLNAELSKLWPVLTERMGAPTDAKDWDGKPDKLKLLER